MGSSYRSSLNAGRGPAEWEAKLTKAVELVKEVREAIWETYGDDGQYDNAADDGALAQSLSFAIRFIEDELPEKKAE